MYYLGMAKIFLAEDNIDLATQVTKKLESLGHETKTLANGLESRRELAKNAYDLAILDIIMPGMNGMELCKLLRREENQIPIIMFTTLGKTEQIIHALELGADDYVTKPFEMDELIARVHSVLKRPFLLTQKEMKVGDLVLDLNRMTANIRKRVVPLTKKEFHILHYLVLNKNHIVSRDKILDNVWESADTPYASTIDVYIASLRKKLGKLGKNISTQHGIGYKFSEKIT